MAKSKKKSAEVQRYGVGEWFGNVVAGLGPARLSELADKAAMRFKAANMPCPYRQESQKDVICNKECGVCSIQIYRRATNDEVAAVGPFVTTCPSRFWQDNNIFRWVGQEVLGTSNPTLIKEVKFLESVLKGKPEAAWLEAGANSNENNEEDDGNEGETDDVETKEAKAVGRIDTILVHPENQKEWCALELQAVYFSGEGMKNYLAQFANAAGLVFPDKNRRPDFRSSGPKRLNAVLDRVLDEIGAEKFSGTHLLELEKLIRTYDPKGDLPAKTVLRAAINNFRRTKWPQLWRR